MRQYLRTVSAVHYHFTGRGTTIDAAKYSDRTRSPKDVGTRTRTMASPVGGLSSMNTPRMRPRGFATRNGGRRGSTPVAGSCFRRKDMFAKTTGRGVLHGQGTTPPRRILRTHGPQPGPGVPVQRGRSGKSRGRQTPAILKRLRSEAASVCRSAHEASMAFRMLRNE